LRRPESAPASADDPLDQVASIPPEEAPDVVAQEPLNPEVQSDIASASAEEPRMEQEAAIEAQEELPPPQQEELPPQPVQSGRPACPECASYVRALDKFCIWCGAKQPQRIPPEMKKCPKCETQLPARANFCFVCGGDVSPHGKVRVRMPTELFQEDDPELFPTFNA
jgi:hypothetical protein